MIILKGCLKLICIDCLESHVGTIVSEVLLVYDCLWPLFLKDVKFTSVQNLWLTFSFLESCKYIVMLSSVMKCFCQQVWYKSKLFSIIIDFIPPGYPNEFSLFFNSSSLIKMCFRVDHSGWVFQVHSMTFQYTDSSAYLFHERFLELAFVLNYWFVFLLQEIQLWVVGFSLPIFYIYLFRKPFFFIFGWFLNFLLSNLNFPCSAFCDVYLFLGNF